MATNEMRREAAKRKLAGQQQRRAERAKRKQRVAIATSVGVVVVVIAGVVLLTTLLPGGQDTADTAADDPAATAPVDPADPDAADPSAADPSAVDPAAPTTDAATPALALGECVFTPTPDEPAAAAAPVPASGTYPTSGTDAITLQTTVGAVPLTLDRSTGPCAVESFVSLTNAGYFTNTPCHRLTTSPTLSVLQCGDPTGTGTGGPGYTISDEPPTFLPPSPERPDVVTYPRGTIAMANTGQPDSGGSQFFLVYADSTLPPTYTAFGTVSEEGLAVLDTVAAAGSDGSSGSPEDGAPVTPVTIQTAAPA